MKKKMNYRSPTSHTKSFKKTAAIPNLWCHTLSLKSKNSHHFKNTLLMVISTPEKTNFPDLLTLWSSFKCVWKTVMGTINLRHIFDQKSGPLSTAEVNEKIACGILLHACVIIKICDTILYIYLTMKKKGGERLCECDRIQYIQVLLLLIQWNYTKATILNFWLIVDSFEVLLTHDASCNALNYHVNCYWMYIY